MKIFVPEIGDITFVRNKNAKRTNIKISSTEGVKVTVSRNGSNDEAYQFVLEKKQWIIANLLKLKSVKSKVTVFTPETEFSTNQHKLHIVPESRNDIKGEIWNKKIIITYPKKIDITEDASQQFIRKMIEEAWRVEAKDYLPTRIKELASIHNFKFQNVFVKNIKTRWGSCSSVNNINLSIHLMRLPTHLIDYVIVHELVHTIHKHHQKSFWDCLESLMPNSKEFAKEVRKVNIKIY